MSDTQPDGDRLTQRLMERRDAPGVVDLARVREHADRLLDTGQESTLVDRLTARGAEGDAAVAAGELVFVQRPTGTDQLREEPPTRLAVAGAEPIGAPSFQSESTTTYIPQERPSVSRPTDLPVALTELAPVIDVPPLQVVRAEPSPRSIRTDPTAVDATRSAVPTSVSTATERQFIEPTMNETMTLETVPSHRIAPSSPTGDRTPIVSGDITATAAAEPVDQSVPQRVTGSPYLLAMAPANRDIVVVREVPAQPRSDADRQLALHSSRNTSANIPREIPQATQQGLTAARAEPSRGMGAVEMEGAMVAAPVVPVVPAEPAALPVHSAEQDDHHDELVERVARDLHRRLMVERERQGIPRWQR